MHTDKLQHIRESPDKAQHAQTSHSESTHREADMRARTRHCAQITAREQTQRREAAHVHRESTVHISQPESTHRGGNQHMYTERTHKADTRVSTRCRDHSEKPYPGEGTIICTQEAHSERILEEHTLRTSPRESAHMTLAPAHTTYAVRGTPRERER